MLVPNKMWRVNKVAEAFTYKQIKGKERKNNTNNIHNSLLSRHPSLKPTTYNESDIKTSF